MKFENIKDEMKKSECDFLMSDFNILTEHFFEKTQKLFGFGLYKEGFEVDDIFESVDKEVHKRHHDVFVDSLDLITYIISCSDVMFEMLDHLDKLFIFNDMNNKVEFLCNSLLGATEQRADILEFLKKKVCIKSQDSVHHKMRVFGEVVCVFSGSEESSMQSAHRFDLSILDEKKHSVYKAFREFDLACLSYKRFLIDNGLEKSKFMRIHDLLENRKYALKESPKDFILSENLIIDLKKDGEIL